MSNGAFIIVARPQLHADVQLLFSEPGEPAMEVTPRGHGRLEHRRVWVSSQLAGYSNFPGPSTATMINKRVEHLKRREYVESVQYAVSNLSSLEPQQALRLVQGHWRIENSLFHVRDDSLGEDRHVMFHHGGGAVLSLLRNVAITLPRGTCSLCSEKEPLTRRAQRLCAHPSTAVTAPT